MRKYNIGVRAKQSNDKEILWVSGVMIDPDGTLYHTLTPYKDEARYFTHNMNLEMAKLDFNRDGYNYVIKKYNIR